MVGKFDEWAGFSGSELMIPASWRQNGNWGGKTLVLVVEDDMVFINAH